jgi:hypothetical protein
MRILERAGVFRSVAALHSAPAAPRKVVPIDSAKSA